MLLIYTINPGSGMGIISFNTSLSTSKRNCLFAQGLNGHGHQSNRYLLSSGQEHIHFSLTGIC
jgi:hypothetical protein